jgi:putative phosphoribosyl transferase
MDWLDFPYARPFRDRTDAGQRLAGALVDRKLDNPVVLALPRGGVPVAFEAAVTLGAPLDVFNVRKLGVPGHEELAVGAIASGGTRVVNRDVATAYAIDESTLDQISRREQQELERREIQYRGGRPPIDVTGRTAILVDDGLATGSTMRAAVQAVRGRGAGRVVVAVPVAPQETCEMLGREADEVICLEMPEPFHAVGLWYVDFLPVADDEIADLLQRARERLERRA